MTLEPVHFRGSCVAFALNRRDGAIGVRRRFRGGRQDRRSCGRRRRAKRRRPAAATPGGWPALGRSNPDDFGAGPLPRLSRRFRAQPPRRGDRRPPPLPRQAAGPAKLRAAERAKRRRPAAATPGGWPALGRSNPDDFGAGPLPRLLRPFRAQPPRRGDRCPPPLPRQAAGRAKLRAAERAKMRAAAGEGATAGGGDAGGVACSGEVKSW